MAQSRLDKDEALEAAALSVETTAAPPEKLTARERSTSIDTGEVLSEDERLFLRQDTGQLYVSVSAIAESSPLPPIEAQKRKLGFALEMLQEYYTRNNLTANMLIQTEVLLVLVSCLVGITGCLCSQSINVCVSSD